MDSIKFSTRKGTAEIRGKARPLTHKEITDFRRLRNIPDRSHDGYEHERYQERESHPWLLSPPLIASQHGAFRLNLQDIPKDIRSMFDETLHPWRTSTSDITLLHPDNDGLEEWSIIEEPTLMFSGEVTTSSMRYSDPGNYLCFIGPWEVSRLANLFLVEPWNKEIPVHCAIISSIMRASVSGAGSVYAPTKGYSEITSGSMGELEISGHDLLKLLESCQQATVLLGQSSDGLLITPDDLPQDQQWLL